MKLIATVEHEAFREFVIRTNLYIVPLEYENVDNEAWMRDTGEVRNDAWLWAHLTDENMSMIMDAAGRMPSATLVRPVPDVEESWIRRGKDMAELAKQLGNLAVFTAQAQPMVLQVANGMDAIIQEFAAVHPNSIMTNAQSVR